MRGVLTAREGVAGRLAIEIVAFATAYTDPAPTEGGRRLAGALGAGADLLGAVPAFHADPDASLEAVLDLARSLGVDVDLHLDETTDPAIFRLERLADATLARGLEGRVTASHCCSLASVVRRRPVVRSRRSPRPGSRSSRSWRPTFTSRIDGGATPRFRGITLVHEFVGAGVPVRFGATTCGTSSIPTATPTPRGRVPGRRRRPRGRRRRATRGDLRRTEGDRDRRSRRPRAPRGDVAPRRAVAEAGGAHRHPGRQAAAELSSDRDVTGSGGPGCFRERVLGSPDRLCLIGHRRCASPPPAGGTTCVRRLLVRRLTVLVRPLPLGPTILDP